MLGLTLKHIKKVYPNGFEAVKKLSLEVRAGEFVSFVGPSGCGKSTTLRMIAGLEEISHGELYIGDKKANALSPRERGIAMVFQSYALFPHMTVAANIGFGLKIQKVPVAERKKKIEWALDLLDLDGLGDRKPAQLSGGQRQRVALGRALVLDPDVLLLDEPLSNLDAKLRIKMRLELKRIHKELNATIIYVTHDQAEAMTLSDRIAILKDGDLMQCGTPTEIYNNPANEFVAGFVGSPPMNFISGQLNSDKENMTFVSEYGTFIFDHVLQTKVQEKGISGPITLGVRPEDITISTQKADNAFQGMSIVTETLGSDDYVSVLPRGVKRGELLTVRIKPEMNFPLDKEVWMEPKTEKIHVFS
ncbi:ABC transporter ATP-binding protein [Vallitalea pronyensis]|uniref:ABC transporter ATP-binding protein n=1 Tax=Vallitalea pronyensis TaxID=1348613 RepID=A0A8J8MNM2_9FIRM|nr:ABC transporter ATP-binding protein [Vallitalea pronyensis]QUI24727.1 ABC transporter ATP-binding protein [Vallitalea pronyensis]